MMTSAQRTTPMGFGTMNDDKAMLPQGIQLKDYQDYDDEEGEFHMSEASEEGTAVDYDSLAD